MFLKIKTMLFTAMMKEIDYQVGVQEYLSRIHCQEHFLWLLLIKTRSFFYLGFLVVIFMNSMGSFYGNSNAVDGFVLLQIHFQRSKFL